MLRNKRESLSHVPKKRLKENLEYYDETALSAIRLTKKLALVAVAHKLLMQAYGVLKNKRPFDENFCT